MLSKVRFRPEADQLEVLTGWNDEAADQAHFCFGTRRELLPAFNPMLPEIGRLVATGHDVRRKCL